MSLTDRIEQSLKLPKTYKPKRAVKGSLCRSFSLDGNLFIEKFDLVNATESIVKRNFRAKAIVDLLMSVECSLKSLYIGLSKDDEEPIKAYKKARRHSHNLNKLYNEVEKRAKNRFKIPSRHTIFDDFKTLGVSSRYAYEIWSIRMNSNDKDIFFDEDLVSRTIDDLEWVKTLRDEAIKLNNLSDKCYSKYMAKHCILNGKKFEQYHQVLQKFLAETFENPKTKFQYLETKIFLDKVNKSTLPLGFTDSLLYLERISSKEKYKKIVYWTEKCNLSNEQIQDILSSHLS